MDCKKIGEYIQLKRKAVGLTQQDLGDKLGVTSKAVSKWECGVALPDVCLFKDLSEILNIEIEELLNGEDNKKIPIDKKKSIAIICLSLVLFFLLISSIYFGVYFYKNYDKVHVYDLASGSKDFRVDGNLFVIGDKKYLAITNVKYNLDKDVYFSKINYEIKYLDSVLHKSDVFDTYDDEKVILEKYLNDFMFFIELPNGDNIYTEDFLILKISFVDDNNKQKSYEVKLNIR